MVCVGMIIGVKGVKGLVRVKSYMADPLDIAAFGPVSTQEGSRQFQFKVVETAKDHLVVSCPQIPDRTAGETLKGTALFLEEALLPTLEEEEYYHKDLLGLQVQDESHKILGTVAAVFNFGAGDFIEISCQEGPVATVPFTKTSVLEVNLKEKYLVVRGEDLLIATRASKTPEQEEKS